MNEVSQAGREAALLDAYSLAVSSAAEKVTPSVVHIEVRRPGGRGPLGATGSGVTGLRKITPCGL